MEILEKKFQRQLVGVDRWCNSKQYGSPRNGCGTLWYYTAVGKTYTALIICNKMFSKNPAATAIILVPSEQLMKDWKQQIKEHVSENFWINIQVYTINYVVENKINTSCSLLIADEIHEYLTPERITYLDNTHIKYQFNLGLTATWEDKTNRQRLLKNICPVIDTISEAEALREGFISKYIEYNLAASFTDEERMEYRAYTDIINRNLPKFANILDVAKKCLIGGVHTDGRIYKGYQFSIGWARRNGWYPDGDTNNEEYRNLNDLWNPNKVIGYSKALMDAIRFRKELIYNVTNKAVIATELVVKYPTLKTICFAQSTHFADKLGLLINRALPGECVVYHSKLATIERLDVKSNKIKKIGKTRLRNEAVAKIRTGDARIISTASALDKGFNVEDIRLGITTSGTQNPTQHIQRGGRVKRLEMYAPDTVVLIVNIYIPDTVDEKWLNSRQKKSDNQIYWVNSVDEINYKPIDKSIIDAELLN